MVVSNAERRVSLRTYYCCLCLLTLVLLVCRFVVLDEPTSGLDSTTAVSLIELLHKYAVQQGKTVITSIHQPSSAVFRSFDRLVLLSDGYVVYFGTPVDSLEYLRSVDLACPDGYNAADHWMDLLVVDTANPEADEDEETTELKSKMVTMSKRSSFAGTGVKPHLKLQQAWDRDAVADEMDLALVESEDDKSFDGVNDLKESKYNSSWSTQYYILVHRALKNSRSAILTPLNLMKSIGLGLATGMIYWHTEYTEKNVADIQAYFFFTMTFWV